MKKETVHYGPMTQYAEQDEFLDDAVCGRQGENADVTNYQHRVTCDRNLKVGLAMEAINDLIRSL